MMKILCVCHVILLSIQVSAQDNFFTRLSDSAFTLTKQHVVYDPQYVRIRYPGGDVPAGTGVCTDVIIRAYRKMGFDLQKAVHEDMRRSFSVYPKIWKLKSPDSNIDHRRVQNLMTYFERERGKLTVSASPSDYKPGEIVCWDLGGGITHIGIVSKFRSDDNKRHKIIHNIGSGQVLEDCLFQFRIIGHYRFEPRN
jgi:uncharacterized protein